MAEFIDLILLIGWGIFLGACFHLYRLLFSLMEGGKIRYALRYIAWWLGLLFLTVYYLLLVNGGQLRLYGLLGMALGIVLFYQWCLPRCGPFFARFFRRFARIFGFFGYVFRQLFLVILYPFAFLLGILEKGISFFFWPLRKLTEKLKKITLQDERE